VQELTPERLTIIGLLLTVLGSGMKKVWVRGYQLLDAEKRKTESDAANDARIREVQERAQRWETIALRALNVGEKVVQGKTNGKD